jgi:DNA (cytosine-5)-methyltransferase 1
MRYGSVCSGIEAATMAWHPLGWTPAFFSEIDKFPSAVLAHHYGSNMPGEPLAKNGIPNYGDFTEIGAEAGPIDLLVGGTPCQSFSVAGKRLGLDDPRGNLALEYLSLARRLRARWIVWENVPGVLSSYSGSEQAAREVQEGPVGGEGAGIEDRDFAMFLSFVRECGYGFAYRVLDAQFVRVDGHARAVPQRRERVFLVGYLGDWRPAAAVLLEPEGMRGDPAPSRKAGQRVAGTVTGGAHPGGFNGQDAYNDKLIASTGSVAHCLNAGGMGRQDFETETMVAHSLRAQSQLSHRLDSDNVVIARATHDVAHSLRAEGYDASEDGTGRGTPIVPVFAHETAATLTRGAESAGKGGYAGRRQEDDVNLVAFNPKMGGDPTMGLGVNVDGTSYTLDHAGNSNAVAYDMRGREGGAQFEGPHETANIRAGSGGSSKSYVAESWAVRRLTPRECERLQGFPDDFTNVPYRGKAAADGPRYKALGNSMAVNAMRWIGQRIDIMEKLIQQNEDAA